MNADLFSPADVPFNLAGETLNNELTEEGARRAQAEAEAEQKKAQQAFDFDRSYLKQTGRWPKQKDIAYDPHKRRPRDHAF